jgi:Ca-activated chloride channel family protein
MFNTLQPVTEDGKTEALAFLDSQRARGGTSLRPALTTAYRYRDPDRTLNVVVLSDGMTEQREQQELLELVTQRPSGSRVFCVGVGNEVNRPLLAQMADEAGGLSAFISQGDDFQRAAQAFRRKLMRPAVNLPMLKIDGIEVYDVEPQTLPDLYHGSPLRVYGRYQGAGAMNVTVDGDALGAPFEQSAKVTLPDVEASNPEIERMWAFHRVQRLMGENRRLGENSAIVDEIVQLCEGYSIAGEYASFIVLENDQEYRRWKIDRRNASRIQRDRASRAAIRQQLEQMREQSLASLGPQAAKSPTEATPAASADPLPSQTASSSRPPALPSTTTPRAPLGPANRSSRSTGGGAIDPLTAAMALGLAAASAAAGIRRRRRRTKSPVS